MPEITLLHFIIFALADWRISNLFANEHGPFDIFAKIRVAAGGCIDSNCDGKSWFAKGLMCEWCNSMWFGTLIILCYLKWSDIVFWICVIAALSTCTILIKFFREYLEKGVISV